MSSFTKTTKARGVTLAFVLWAASANAGQSSGSFNVNIALDFRNPTNLTGFCVKNQPLGFGAAIVVACSTGAMIDLVPTSSAHQWIPTHGGAYRYSLQTNLGAGLPATIDGYTIDSFMSIGSVTSWRMVNLSNRDYLELLVGW